MNAISSGLPTDSGSIGAQLSNSRSAVSSASSIDDTLRDDPYSCAHDSTLTPSGLDPFDGCGSSRFGDLLLRGLLIPISIFPPRGDASVSSADSALRSSSWSDGGIDLIPASYSARFFRAEEASARRLISSLLPSSYAFSALARLAWTASSSVCACRRWASMS